MQSYSICLQVLKGLSQKQVLTVSVYPSFLLAQSKPGVSNLQSAMILAELLETCGANMFI